MSDTIAVNFGLQVQLNANVQTTPLTISADLGAFTNPIINTVFGVTTLGTTPASFPGPNMAAYRCNFNATVTQAFFTLVGSSNVIVVFDDPASAALTCDIALSEFIAGFNFPIFKYTGYSIGGTQNPIIVRRPDLNGIGGGTNFLLDCVTKSPGGYNIDRTAPNVDFSCSVYCF